MALDKEPQTGLVGHEPHFGEMNVAFVKARIAEYEKKTDEELQEIIMDDAHKQIEFMEQEGERMLAAEARIREESKDHFAAVRKEFKEGGVNEEMIEMLIEGAVTIRALEESQSGSDLLARNFLLESTLNAQLASNILNQRLAQ